MNGWVRNVTSYAPPSNPRGYHLLSDGIVLERSRHVTVEDTDLRRPQNRGGGGNGYPYRHQGNDNLIQRATAVEGRHNFSFKTAVANGNVIRDSYASRGSLNSDFHMHLSMANLVENVSLDQDVFEADWRRDYGDPVRPHALTGTQNVFWNMNGAAPRGGSAYSVLSDQFGWGLVIGTRGAVPGVRLPVTIGRTEPQDVVEGEGQGETLVPQSLYLDQLARRLGSPSGPSPVRVILSGSQFRAGQTLTVGLVAATPSGAPPADLFVGVVLPDGRTAIFFTGSPGALSGPVSLATPARFPRLRPAPPPFTLNEAAFFRFTFPPTGVPPGAYWVFAALVRQGGLLDDQVGGADILALDVAALTFSP